MARTREKKERRTHEITSLIDVVFILLIFFMVIIVPGSGGGEEDSQKIDLPRVLGDTPDELLKTLAFRIERDPAVDSESSPNVIYVLLPYEITALERNKNISYGRALLQAKNHPQYSLVIDQVDGQEFPGDSTATDEFINLTLENYLADNHDQLGGVMISAITETPFGLIEYISKACDKRDIMNLEFRTAYP